MSIFDELIKVDKDGNIKSEIWVEWQHISSGLLHCPICLVLNGCWFNLLIKPQLPQHEKCHCKVKNIVKPIPNKTACAKCNVKKFTDYIFSEKYAWNGKKALFEILGFKKEDSEYLQKEYEKQALLNYCNSNYKLGKLDTQGQRININIEFVKNSRKVVFNSGWMIRPKGEITINTPLAD